MTIYFGDSTNQTTAAVSGGGKILQVVTAQSDSQTSGNTNTWTTCPASVSITPQSSSNHILIYCHAPMGSNTREDFQARFKRDSTIIAVSSNDAHGQGYSAGGITEDWSGYTFNPWWKDSPSSTRSITYTM